MSLFYSYIAGSLHVSGPQDHLRESSCSCSHNHWFSICATLFTCSVCVDNIQITRTERYRYWTNGCVNSCTNSPEDGPVGPKHVETQQYTNKIVTSVRFHSISSVCVWCSCLLVICLWTCFIHFTCYEVIRSYIYCRYFVVYIYLLFAVFSLDSIRFLFCISLCQDICSLATV
jgi:hypothetical protein